jgi:FKBP-type peptidyl-prolyl cis-trans isomerase SlyD
MKIHGTKVVGLHYRLREGSAEGELIEETYGSDPLYFIYGNGQMIPGFEANLLHKSIGDTYSFLLNPAEGYGVINEEDFVEVPIENFVDPETGKVERDHIQTGVPITMSDEHGHRFSGFITKVGLDTVTVNFNHPMAGMHLHFEGEIIEVRDATDSEIDHGHVHGPGGHHH